MLTIAELDDATIELAGALVAEEQAAAIQALPSLPAAYTDPAVCAAALQRLRDTGYRGALAAGGGRPLALLTGRTVGDQVHLFAEGVAVAPGLPDPCTTLARLYGELAPGWVAGAALRHYLDHPALATWEETVANLGFGRHHVYATQPAAPRSGLTDVRVRVGGDDDLASVACLALVEIRFRTTPPIYSRPAERPVEALVDEHRALRERGATHFIAALDGRDVGLLTVELTSPEPRLCSDGQSYIGPTATEPDARGRGVGRALVDAALTWAHASGHRWVSVDFEPANPLSRPFWLGNGFRPTGYCVVRVIHPAYHPG